MADKSNQEIPTLSRRKFLRRAGAAGAAVLIAKTIGTGKSPEEAQVSASSPIPINPPHDHSSHIHTFPLPPALGGGEEPLTSDEPSHEPAILPDDVISKEQLAKSHIRIVDEHLDTKLFLRKKALDQFKLFRDAKTGRVDEAVIVLVNGQSLNWKNVQKLPEKERDIYRAIYDGPEDEPVRQYLRSVKSYESDIVYWKGILSGEIKPDPKSPPFDNNKIIEFIENQERQLTLLKSKGPPVLTPAEFEDRSQEPIGWGVIAHTYNLIVNPSTWENPQDPKVKRQKMVQEKYGNLNNKVYIFLAVEGNVEPNPKQQYPKPDRFKSYTGNPKGYIYQDLTLGFALAHELKHWKGMDGKYGITYDETGADAQAFSRMADARNLLDEEKDDSGYSFVFRNKRGMTITANQNAPRETNQNL